MFRPMVKVIDHTTGKEYRSINKAAEDLFVSSPTISMHEHNKRFMCVGHELELIETERYGISVRVRCVETGKVYNSISAAAREIGVSDTMIRYAIKRRGGRLPKQGITIRKVINDD